LIIISINYLIIQYLVVLEHIKSSLTIRLLLLLVDEIVVLIDVDVIICLSW